jgi:hypothetical protein
MAASKAAAIAACRDTQGRITPRAVWQAARDPNHVLHREFQWDIKKAAEREWDRTAAELIREVRFVVTYEDRKIRVPCYVSDPREKASSYIPVARIARNSKASHAVLQREVEQIVGLIERGLKIAASFGLVSSFERMLREAQKVERELADLDRDEARV